MSIQPTSSSVPLVPLVDIHSRGDARSATSSTDQTQTTAADKTAASDKQSPAGTIKQPTTQQMVKEAADKANNAISALKSNLQFTVDKDSGINIVKIVDTETNKTIRQIPSEEMISIAHRLEEIKGLLIKNTA
jgi:flagellar protein FlaG